jgi:hypothetical protein
VSAAPLSSDEALPGLREIRNGNAWGLISNEPFTARAPFDFSQSNWSRLPLGRTTVEAALGTIILLLGLGTIGAWAGWALSMRLFYGQSYYSFEAPRLRIWSLLPAIVFAFVGVVFGYALLICLGA